jgi:hypothetical protein
VQENVLGAAQLAVRELDLPVAHRDRGLAQEAARTVVEHHDQLLGLRAEHCAFAVGTRRGKIAHLDGSPWAMLGRGYETRWVLGDEGSFSLRLLMVP